MRTLQWYENGVPHRDVGDEPDEVQRGTDGYVEKTWTRHGLVHPTVDGLYCRVMYAGGDSILVFQASDRGRQAGPDDADWAHLYDVATRKEPFEP
jgi:hypothetical protein